MPLPDPLKPPAREQVDRAFPCLSPEQRLEIAAHLRVRRLKPAEHLFTAGDVADGLYVMLEGRVAVKKMTGWGRNNQVIALLSPPAPIGEAALIGGGERKTTVEAVDDTVVLCLPKDVFQMLESTQPVLAVKLVTYLLRITCLRLERCSSRLAHIL